MKYESALAYMDGLLPLGWKLGLERFTELCNRLNNPQNHFGVIHVAGTKGKGSTTAMCAGMLKEIGCKAGAYYSPYVYDVRERVQINGKMISRAAFARQVDTAKPVIEELACTEFGQTSEFELKTIIGFLAFSERDVDWACIEVGLGGRLDATNVVRPEVTVITNIGLDHTQILGDTHELIAAEKAGIIKEGVPCITATDHPGALDVITRTANQRNAPLIVVSRGDASAPTGKPGSVYWEPTSHGPYGEHYGGIRVATETRVYAAPEVAMQGSYQRINAACSVAAVELAMKCLGERLYDGPIRRALRTVSLPGRLATIDLPQRRVVAIDGAHNEMAAAALKGPLEAIRKRRNLSRVLIVIGMLSGHQPEPVLHQLVPGSDRVFLCSPNWKRALPTSDLSAIIRDELPGHDVEECGSVKSAVEAAIRFSRPGDLIVITGSFYTVGEAEPGWILQLGEQYLSDEMH